MKAVINSIQSQRVADGYDGPGPWWRPVVGFREPRAEYRCVCGSNTTFDSNRITPDGHILGKVVCHGCDAWLDVALVGWSRDIWCMVEFVGGGCMDGDVEARLFPLPSDTPTLVTLNDGTQYALERRPNGARFYFIPSPR